MKLILVHRNKINCTQFYKGSSWGFNTKPGKPDVCEAAAHSYCLGLQSMSES